MEPRTPSLWLAVILQLLYTSNVLARHANESELHQAALHLRAGPVGGPGRPGRPSNSHLVPSDLPEPPAPQDGIFEDGSPQDSLASMNDRKLFDLGTYEGSQDALFENFLGANEPYMSKVYDIFASIDSNLLASEDPYAAAPPSQQPFAQGSRPTSGEILTFLRTITVDNSDSVYTSTFNPAAPTDVCRAWTSLVNYCGGDDVACACYSNSFYVPEQWNSLAAGCASYTGGEFDAPVCPGPDNAYWCDLASIAGSQTDNCPDEGPNAGPTYNFGAVWGPQTTAATDPAVVTDSLAPDDSTSSEMPETTDDSAPGSTSSVPQPTATMNLSSSATPATTSTDGYTSGSSFDPTSASFTSSGTTGRVMGHSMAWVVLSIPLLLYLDVFP